MLYDIGLCNSFSLFWLETTLLCIKNIIQDKRVNLLHLNLESFIYYIDETICNLINNDNILVQTNDNVLYKYKVQNKYYNNLNESHIYLMVEYFLYDLVYNRIVKNYSSKEISLLTSKEKPYLDSKLIEELSHTNSEDIFKGWNVNPNDRKRIKMIEMTDEEKVREEEWLGIGKECKTNNQCNETFITCVNNNCEKTELYPKLILDDCVINKDCYSDFCSKKINKCIPKEVYDKE